jgi:hypothetical protein
MFRRVRHEWILSGTQGGRGAATLGRSATFRRCLRVERLEERCLLAINAAHVPAGDLVLQTETPSSAAQSSVWPAAEDHLELLGAGDPMVLPSSGSGSGSGHKTMGSWVLQGGAGIEGGQTEPNTQPNKRVTGAIHTILAHPTNPDILYIGAVNGGVWKTSI